MQYRGHKQARIADVGRWRLGRGGSLWGRGPTGVGRSFEEDLALFERQVREEAGGEGARPASSPPATLSA